jgi:hypothetical protein
MSTMCATRTKRRELARRASGGVEIALYWSPSDDSTSLEIFVAATAETITLGVAQERALDAFNHPFAYVCAAA